MLPFGSAGNSGWPSYATGALGSAVLLIVALHMHYSGVFDPAAGPEKPYLKALVPAFRYGCKRITPHDEYLSSETGKKRVTEQYFLSIFVQKNLQLSPDPM